MNRKQNNTSHPQDDIEKTVFDAMRLDGWILPQTPDEVSMAEADLAGDPVRLPPGLTDPYSVLERPSQGIRVGGQPEVVPNGGVEQNLAQAAREGGEIPPEVHEQMQKDRDGN